jgi:hypothetical protein
MASGFMQAKNSDGSWADPKEGWTEGNTWVYSWPSCMIFLASYGSWAGAKITTINLTSISAVAITCTAMSRAIIMSHVRFSLAKGTARVIEIVWRYQELVDNE